MRNTFRSALLFVVFFAVPSFGQERWDEVVAKSTSLKGLQLYGVSAFGSYTNLAGPRNLQEIGYIPPDSGVGGDWSYGVQWTVGWQPRRWVSNHLSVMYNGTYSGQYRYSNLNGFGHSATISFSHPFGAKWTFSISGRGDYRTLGQYLFSPLPLGTLSQTSATSDQLASSFGVGQAPDPNTAAMLASDAVSMAARTLLVGEHILVWGVQAGASYAYSSRLNFSFSSVGAGGRTQFGQAAAYKLPTTISATAGLSATTSYNLSPRTTLGVTVNESRVFNRYQGSYNTEGTVSLGRRMSTRWFLNGQIGGAYLRFVKSASGLSPQRHIIGGAGLGYATYSQTFLISYSATSFDTYGLATGMNNRASAAWGWHRPGTSWMLNAAAGRQQIRYLGFTGLTGWQGSAGIGRRMGSHFMVTSEYVYLRSAGTYANFPLLRNIQAARISLGWSPHIFREDAQALP